MVDWRCPRCGAQPLSIREFPAFAPELAEGAEGYDPSFFADLAQLENDSFWFGGRNRLIIWALQRFFPDAQNFLEVGCGTGFVLAGLAGALPHLRLAGSEASISGLEFAAQRVPSAQLLQLDARRIPYRDEFDVVGAFDVIEHIADDRRVLNELGAAVVPGGGLLLTVPQHPSLWSEYDARAGHQRRYRRLQLLERVLQAGFEIVKVTSFLFFLLPLLYLLRLARLRSDLARDPLADLRLPRQLNRTLAAVLDLERALIRAGLSLPAGGSLLVAARRRES